MKTWTWYFLWVAVAWSIAVLIKVVRHAREDGRRYELSWWDGGLTLARRVLSRSQTLWFGEFAAMGLLVSVFVLVTWPQETELQRIVREAKVKHAAAAAHTRR